MSNFDEFKEVLNDLLIEHKLSRLQLAKQIGITSTTINDYFNKNYYPRIDIAVKMSNFFNCSLDYLFGFTTTKNLKHNYSSQNFIKNFINKFNILIKDNNSSIAKTMKVLNMSETNYYRWKSGKFPKTINLLQIAKYFNVSLDYLLC